MRPYLTAMLVFLLMGTAPVWAESHAGKAASKPPDPQDLKVIAVMEILQLLEMTDEMEMMSEMEYLIEDDQDESIED